MRTYKLFGLLTACLIIFSCSKSDEEGGEGVPNPGADADYTLLLNSGGSLSGQLLNANADLITLNPAEAGFETMGRPDLSYRDGNAISFYDKKGDCSGMFSKYNFETDSQKEQLLFEDLGDCGLTAYAIAHSENKIYVAYGVAVNATNTDYFIRIVDLGSDALSFEDISIDKKPQELVFTNNRLFILTLDEAVSNENFLSVMDSVANALIIEMKLGFDAKRLIKKDDGNLIIAFDELHGLMDSQTLSVTYVSYQEDLQTRFRDSEFHSFDLTGKMYYIMDPEDRADYPLLPAIYDFTDNLIVLYDYEQFLTEQERNFEYEIETTTMVDFDDKNGYLLIGYKKIGVEKGGLLRVRTGAKPAVIDNLDLEGVPYAIVVQ